MTIFKKLADARSEFHGLKLSKSGKNKHMGYAYFELGDFLIPGMQCMKNAGIIAIVSFEKERCVMRIHELEGDGVIEIESPRSSVSLKACHEVQNLGAEETYQRRYLWMAALEIVEHDAVSQTGGNEGATIEYVSESNAKYIEEMIDKTKTDRSKFFQYYKVNSVGELTADKAAEAITMLEAKE